MMKKLRAFSKPVSLATRLAVFIFLINTVVLTSFGVYYARRFSVHIEEGLIKGSSIPAMLMKQNSENYKLLRDPFVLRRLVGRPVEHAMLISCSGRILYSMDPEMEGLSLPHLSSRHPLFSQLTQTDCDVNILRPVVRTRLTRSVVSQISTSDEEVGYLWISVNVEGDALSKKQIAMFFFLGGLAAIIFCGFSQFYLVHHLVIPRVRRMAHCIQLVEKGELEVRIAGSRMHDELGGLETSINQMVAELESRALLQRGLMSDLESEKEVSEIANRCKNEFLANISHELRTPMNAVIGLSELLLDTSLDSGQKEYVETVLQSGEWLLSIVNNILALVKLESDRQRVRLSPVSLSALFGELNAHYRPFADGCGLEFSCQIEEGVPDCIVSSDEILQQVLGNLLLNGFKFTHEGFVRLLAKLVRGDEDNVCAIIEFSVQDSGIGISKEARGTIYDAFTQVDGSIARKYGGVGLGLTISKQLISLLGGHLELTSEVGDGSSFFFSIEAEVVDQTVQLSDAMDEEAMAEMDAEALAELGELAPSDSGEIPSDEVTESVPPEEVPPIQPEPASPEEPVIQPEPAPVAESVISPEPVTPPEPEALSEPAALSEAATLSVPAAVPEPEQSVSAESAQVATSEADEAEPKPRVLVVEDNKVNRMMLKMSLKRAGCEVQEAENGLAALQLLGLDEEKTGPVDFDLIMMDIQMPIMDGIEATRHIRKQQRGGSPVPIVAVTAHMMEGDCEQFIQSEMDDYIPKPVKANSLATVLSRFLGFPLPSKTD